MCMAKKRFLQEARERGMTPGELEREMIYYCRYPPDFFRRGFIFPDGSVLEIGPYEDHRVIPIDEWNSMHLVTYDVKAEEADFRVNWGLTWEQAEVMAEMINLAGSQHVYIDVYSRGDIRKKPIEYVNKTVTPGEIYEDVMESMQNPRNYPYRWM